MDFLKLNRVAKGQHRTVKKIADLELGREYKIEGVRGVNTRYGKKVIVEIEGAELIFLSTNLSKMLLENEENQLIALRNQMAESDIGVKRIPGYNHPLEFVKTNSRQYPPRRRPEQSPSPPPPPYEEFATDNESSRNIQ